ncbi:hypothetical protein MACK_000565 [Theileria orientalis]|uniref:Uncharacterized protein n=1 Tax=Theileria orientalis TaxID=68886 RepID=A0A976QUG2_THEOR|nr:hypothetical protein MACK_000565 [Theileria orientalis]
MNTLFFFLSFVFGVSAVPVVFDKPLWEGKDARFAHVLHGKVDEPKVGGTKLRFLLLVPKLGADVKEFHTGLTPKPVNFLGLGTGEVLTGLFGLSDCKTWHALTWDVLNGGVLATKFVVGVKDGETFVHPLVVGGWDGFADFVHGKVTLAAFKELWKLLPSHLAVHKVWWTFKDVWSITMFVNKR